MISVAQLKRRFYQTGIVLPPVPGLFYGHLAKKPLSTSVFLIADLARHFSVKNSLTDKFLRKFLFQIFTPFIQLNEKISFATATDLHHPRLGMYRNRINEKPFYEYYPLLAYFIDHNLRTIELHEAESVTKIRCTILLDEKLYIEKIVVDEKTISRDNPDFFYYEMIAKFNITHFTNVRIHGQIGHIISHTVFIAALKTLLEQHPIHQLFSLFIDKLLTNSLIAYDHSTATKASLVGVMSGVDHNTYKKKMSDYHANHHKNLKHLIIHYEERYETYRALLGENQVEDDSDIHIFKHMMKSFRTFVDAWVDATYPTEESMRADSDLMEFLALIDEQFNIDNIEVFAVNCLKDLKDILFVALVSNSLIHHIGHEYILCENALFSLANVQEFIDRKIDGRDMVPPFINLLTLGIIRKTISKKPLLQTFWNSDIQALPDRLKRIAADFMESINDLQKLARPESILKEIRLSAHS